MDSLLLTTYLDQDFFKLCWGYLQSFHLEDGAIQSTEHHNIRNFRSCTHLDHVLYTVNDSYVPLSVMSNLFTLFITCCVFKTCLFFSLKSLHLYHQTQVIILIIIYHVSSAKPSVLKNFSGSHRILVVAQHHLASPDHIQDRFQPQHIIPEWYIFYKLKTGDLRPPDHQLPRVAGLHQLPGVRVLHLHKTDENEIQLAQLCVTIWWRCVLGQNRTLWGGGSWWLMILGQ